MSQNLSAVYFASDFHLGSAGRVQTFDREKRIVNWINTYKSDMEALYLVGDVFDFWFDYKKVVPRGFIRILGKLAELKDAGIPVYYFTGNHDLWMFDYLQKELEIPIYHKPIEVEIQGKKFMIGHGDGLGPGDYGYKRLKKLFSNPFAQKLFQWLHPDLGIGLADYFSSKSREAQDPVQFFLGSDKEWLIQYAEFKLQEKYFDYFVFGHRHLPIDFTLKNGTSRYINLGDWISFQSFGILKNGVLELQFYQNEHGKIYP
ncbi:MAG: UDP-2,3-diacylglucosamine diphosphatase [Saprospiraceae bacterium]|nr:UDP-2,3-diacylglucosamine diphosphatase [Saprospiraceae bacterium]